MTRYCFEVRTEGFNTEGFNEHYMSGAARFKELVRNHFGAENAILLSKENLWFLAFSRRNADEPFKVIWGLVDTILKQRSGPKRSQEDQKGQDQNEVRIRVIQDLNPRLTSIPTKAVKIKDKGRQGSKENKGVGHSVSSFDVQMRVAEADVWFSDVAPETVSYKWRGCFEVWLGSGFLPNSHSSVFGIKCPVLSPFFYLCFVGQEKGKVLCDFLEGIKLVIFYTIQLFSRAIMDSRKDQVF